MKKQGIISVAGVVLFTSILSATLHAAATELVGTQTVWRVWAATGSRIHKDPNGKTLELYGNGSLREYLPKTASMSDLPPADWNKPDFDDGLWARYENQIFDVLGGYGNATTYNPKGPYTAALWMRTRFGIADPAKAKDLKVFVEYLGGAVVYVNGVEVGRSHLPDGTLDATSLASDYPLEAYTTDDGQTPLPSLRGEWYDEQKPNPQWLSRYQTRIRSMTLEIPAKLLVKGTNLLTVELHRARFSGPTLANFIWGHVGIRAITVSSAGGDGTIAYSEALKDTRVWSAPVYEQVTENPVPGARFPNPGQRGIYGRGRTVTGVSHANPFDPVTPVRILVPRNGIGTGMTVLADPAGLHGVSASLKGFMGPNGAVLPASVTHLRFASQNAGFHWCDTLLEKPTDGAKTIPVWVEVNAPKNQAPGWYKSELSLVANGKQFQVPVQVLVTGYVVPDPRDFRSLVGVMHSPEAAAKVAQAAPWSDAHFAAMAKSLEAAGKLGNDILYVPVMVGSHMGHQTGLIRWVKTAKGLQPDFSAFEKYLDLYSKYCATPRAIVLQVWSIDTVKEVANAYEGRAIPTRESKPSRPLQVTQWDPVTGTNTTITAPTFTDEGAETFWKPMLDGVHAIVLKRGWSERVILVGTGGDTRPSKKTGESFRQWAPYARWDIWSHFSGDPTIGGGSPTGKGGGTLYKGPALEGSAPGKLIAIGNLEVGLKEYPGGIDEIGLQKLDFLALPQFRIDITHLSPPLTYWTLPLLYGRLARVGLDWQSERFGLPIWGTVEINLLSQGPVGTLPGVRFQMMREGFQNFEPRLTIMEAIEKLPPEARKPYQALLGGIGRFWGIGGSNLSQLEHNLNWPAYIAQTYRVAEELSGIKTDASWENPPK